MTILHDIANGKVGVRVFRKGSDVDDGEHFPFTWYITDDGHTFRVYWENSLDAAWPNLTTIVTKDAQVIRGHGVRSNLLDRLTEEEYTVFVAVLSKADELYERGMKDVSTEAFGRGEGGD